MQNRYFFDQNSIIRLERWSEERIFISQPESLDANQLQGLLSALGDDYFCLFPTSGTTQGYSRWVVNKQSHFLKQVAETIQALNIDSGQRWGLLLPTYHVGGFALYLRSVLSRGELISGPSGWDPLGAWQWLEREGIHYISVVPTQIHDWVNLGLRAPPSLRLVFVGGASLSESLQKRASDLGWPLLRVYGMTETNAFFAYEVRGYKGYRAIPSYQWRISDVGELWIQSPYLALGYWSQQEGCIPLEKNASQEWLGPDRVKVETSSGTFAVVGRWHDDLFKRNGRSFSLSEVKKDLWEFIKPHLPLQAWGEEVSLLLLCPCERSQNRLALVYGGPADFAAPWAECLKRWNKSYPWLPVDFCYLPLERWPKTAVGKTHVALLKEEVCALTKSSLSSTVKQHES
ncbi:MAG: AMP-binding protein [Bdellovibrionaceae bacterium]|jgi:O-succinylbenzoic acid--CoA ligase|nr:AMP-binding protein [Pseudobdellovibrionaceae bacterium]